ncbi:MAG: RNA polymerase subunit sigma-24 [Flavobacteriales bacterium]|nr:RNA polymerase subunit sigma-24 [Flavobacteriales bacterium]|tara:strand:- start:382 stop:969 length:588 start_codon:yes stop_codon:yes gene_type:complete
MSKHIIKDEHLISSYIQGSENSLNILINRHKSRIIAFIISKVKDRTLAEDIFQETFLKVINTLKRGKYNEEGKFVPWVMRIAYNLSIDHFRKIKKTKFVRSNDEFDVFNIIKDSSISKEDEMIKSRIISDLKSLIQYLPPAQKEVLKMRYYSNMSFNEIAENCNISINTALGRMRYALINLRKIIKNKGVVMSLD